jgi:predicted permease
VARLANGVAPAVAADMASAGVRGRQTSSRQQVVVRLDPIVPGKASRQSPQSRIALWLTGVSVIVLLIATANVGTLLLLRAERRRRDLAVRIALGAGQVHLARQLLIESLLLALTGAAAGLVLSRWFSGLLRVTLLPTLAPSEGFVDRRVLIVSIVVAGIAGILAGISPLIRRRETNLSLDLRGSHTGSPRFTFQNILVGVQVALCAVLLVGAGLFVRSLQRVQSQDLGFSTSGLLYISLDFRGYSSGLERDVTYEDAVRRLRGMREVTSASVVQAMPFGNFHVPPINIPGGPESPASVWGQLPYMYGATPEYLAMMKVTLVQGRSLTPQDRRGTPLVALVNETMARTVWPDQPAIGKCIRAGMTFNPPGEGGLADPALPCRTVVGVVRDSRARSLRADAREAHLMQFYVPFSQLPERVMDPEGPQIAGLLVQVAGNPERVASTIQRTIQSTSTIPVFARVRLYQDLLDPQLRSWRLGAVLFSVFSALALGIAAVGLFGVVSYLVAQRTQEIGVRLALGGTRAAMWRMVVTDAVRLVAVGIVIGGLAAMAAGPLIRSMLFQTSPWEPANLVSAIAVLLGVTVVAAIWPAWRAGRVDPLVALRVET